MTVPESTISLASPDVFEWNVFLEEENFPSKHKDWMFKRVVRHQVEAVHPDIPKIVGHLLANLFTKECENLYFSHIQTLVKVVCDQTITQEAVEEASKIHTLKENTFFVSVEKNATGIGQAVFSAFRHASFVQTTRERFLDKMPYLDFKTDITTNQVCYLSDIRFLKEATQVVLIADEISTVENILPFIRALDQACSHKRYTVLTLLDSRTKGQETEYDHWMRELGIQIDVISLFRGQIDLSTTSKRKEPDPQLEMKVKGRDYRKIVSPLKSRVEVLCENNIQDKWLLWTGRFGITSLEQEKVEDGIKDTGMFLQGLRKGKNTLCWGHGELIYLPSRIASYMGDGVAYTSSSQWSLSQIQDEHCPIPNGQYEEVMVFFERYIDKKTLESLYKKIKAKGVSYVSFVWI